MLDPGLDFGKTPRQSLDLVARADEVHAGTDRPLLFAISRGRTSSGRSPTPRRGPLRLGHAGDGRRPPRAAAPASILRVHDVAAAAQYLLVRAHIVDPSLLAEHARLDEGLRRVEAPTE